MQGYKFKAILVGTYNWHKAKVYRLGFFDSEDDAWRAFDSPMTPERAAFVDREGRASCRVDVFRVNPNGTGTRVATLDSPDQHFVVDQRGDCSVKTRASRRGMRIQRIHAAS